MGTQAQTATGVCQLSEKKEMRKEERERRGKIIKERKRTQMRKKGNKVCVSLFAVG